MLELTTEEESLLNYVGANYAHVVVLINSTNVMELGQIETIPGVDACLIAGLPIENPSDYTDLLCSLW